MQSKTETIVKMDKKKKYWFVSFTGMTGMVRKFGSGFFFSEGYDYFPFNKILKDLENSYDNVIEETMVILNYKEITEDEYNAQQNCYAKD